MGDQIILIWGSRTGKAYEGLPQGRYIRLEDRDVDALLAEVPAVLNASPEYQTQSAMKGPAGESTPSISGVRPSFGKMRKLDVLPGGRFINEPDEKDRRRVAVLGAQVKQDLFGEGDAIGKTVEMSGVPFLVVGSLPKKDQDSNYNGPDDTKVFIPAATAHASLGIERPGNFVVELQKGSKGKVVMKDINQVFGRLHHYDPTDEEALMTWDVGEMIGMLTTVFLGFKVFLALIGALTLAVAGIGVANIMSMVVEDRTSHIGIAMALGARNRWVLGQILLETLLVTTVGGGAGVLLAVVVVGVAGHAPMGEMGAPVFSWQIAALTAGLLGIIGIASGMGPARRAARLNPAEALRS
jgi:putative ABC transport system permease protein